MPQVIKPPANLRSFLFHGVDLAWSDKEQAEGDCPFCGKEGRFRVAVETGQWDCKACGEHGNPILFLRLLWERSLAYTEAEAYADLARDRGLMSYDTLHDWGACQSIITGEWLLPGYNAKLNLMTLYRWSRDLRGRRLLLATPYEDSSNSSLYAPDKDKITNGLFLPVGAFNQDASEVFICEGPWDGMALWELNHTRCVLSVPGAGVFSERWLPLFPGKSVVLLYDNDHPKEQKGATVDGAGLTGMKRSARILASAKEPVGQLRYLQWGEVGYDPSLPDGYDLRDLLTPDGPETQLDKRVERLSQLLSLVAPVPESWIEGASAKARLKEVSLLPCTSWKELRNHWRKALHWRDDLDHALAVMLAVVLSTEQQGDQLFLQVVADAGSAKTKLCDGLLSASKYCFPLEHLTGFHSGWKDGSGEDYSLLARVNGKTMITPEGDVLMSSPHFAEIMSQQRRIFDGTSGASYKNRKEDMRYVGLRTPWIIAGTPALLNMNQARLGDRFLRVIIGQPTGDECDTILRRAGYSAARSVEKKSNCDPSSITEAKLLEAYRRTGGYVEYLRADPESLLAGMSSRGNGDEVIDECAKLAKFTAAFRARGDTSKDERHDSKELPTRLVIQFVRLAYCLAVVYNHDAPGEKELSVIRKVALDTSRGQTLEIGKRLWKEGLAGSTVDSLAIAMGESPAKIRNQLQFLARIDVVKWFRPEAKNLSKKVRWKLTPQMRELCHEVLGD